MCCHSGTFTEHSVYALVSKLFVLFVLVPFCSISLIINTHGECKFRNDVKELRVDAVAKLYNDDNSVGK